MSSARLIEVIQPVVRRYAGRCNPADAAVIFASQAGGFCLESVCNTSGYGRFSVFGCHPVATACVPVSSNASDALPALHQLAEHLRPQVPVARAELPFTCGWVGYVPYEAGAEAENVAPRPEPGRKRPSLRFALYDTVAVLDHATGAWSVCGADLPQSIDPVEHRMNRLCDLLSQAEGEATLYQASSPPPVAALPAPNMTREAYLSKVARAVEHIAAGDIYQVNLTQRFTAKVESPPLELYMRLRQANPADYAAFLAWPDRAVISCSPELFLNLDGRQVVTRPIKGTRPRSGDKGRDAALCAELAASEKDRAELNMIVDLLRNDLGRVCAFGSVRVRSAAAIEIHPTVIHLVATISGQLRPDHDAIDLLRATFPGGSITGCPKIRAMQIIRELEPTPRDVYCGAIGYVGLDGRLKMNIAIRTMLYEAGRLHVYAGGAITADSDAESEYRETLAKAEGMFRSLGHSTAELADHPAQPTA